MGEIWHKGKRKPLKTPQIWFAQGRDMLETQIVRLKEQGWEFQNHPCFCCCCFKKSSLCHLPIEMYHPVIVCHLLSERLAFKYWNLLRASLQWSSIWHEFSGGGVTVTADFHWQKSNARPEPCKLVPNTVLLVPTANASTMGGIFSKYLSWIFPLLVIKG